MPPQPSMMPLRLFAGFLIALAGALLAVHLDLPLPWMLGPLLATAATRIRGMQTVCPAPLRNAGQWVIGTSLGLYFTPQVVGHVVDHAPAIVAGMVFPVLLCGLGAILMQRFAKVDFQTAWFSCAIGGASEMTTLAERHGANLERVATAHSVRILLVVMIVPFLFQAWGVAGLDPSLPGTARVDPPGLFLLVALTCASAFLFAWRKLPAPWILGPLAVAMGLTTQDVSLSALPAVVTAGGQLLIGWSLGDRYRPGFFRGAPSLVLTAALYTVLSLLLAAGFACLLVLFTDVPLPTLILGTTPGGIAEMAITAKVLQLGVPVVTAFHVTRMVFVVLVTGPLYRLVSRKKSAEKP
ncbi:Ammonia monooxygenase [plant metagenome]|uniref:Ammonia monooxygenase n=3 Tax=root TaxID=1 RepID=A0A1C3K754_9BURK|nr:Ammonia monooxygenase [Orrella dioscoreae]SOE46136.1 Ammonia monooxygenase [Orrella dioscoreae]